MCWCIDSYIFPHWRKHIGRAKCVGMLVQYIKKSYKFNQPQHYFKRLLRWSKGLCCLFITKRWLRLGLIYETKKVACCQATFNNRKYYYKIKPNRTGQDSSLSSMLQQSHLQIAPENLHNHTLQLTL